MMVMMVVMVVMMMVMAGLEGRSGSGRRRRRLARNRIQNARDSLAGARRDAVDDAANARHHAADLGACRRNRVLRQRKLGGDEGGDRHGNESQFLHESSLFLRVHTKIGRDGN
jgi:hypothetical protein